MAKAEQDPVGRHAVSAIADTRLPALCAIHGLDESPVGAVPSLEREPRDWAAACVLAEKEDASGRWLKSHQDSLGQPPLLAAVELRQEMAEPVEKVIRPRRIFRVACASLEEQTGMIPENAGVGGDAGHGGLHRPRTEIAPCAGTGPDNERHVNGVHSRVREARVPKVG